MKIEKFVLEWEDLFKPCNSLTSENKDILFEGENGAICKYNSYNKTVTFTHIPNEFTDLECMNQKFRLYDPLLSVSKSYKSDKTPYEPPSDVEITKEGYKELTQAIDRLVKVFFGNHYYTMAIHTHDANLEILHDIEMTYKKQREVLNFFIGLSITLEILLIIVIILFIFK